MSSFKLLYVISILLALGVGYFLGKKYNPKSAKVVIEQVTEQKTIEKEIKYDVVVEKQIDSVPKFINYKGEELVCAKVAKTKLMLPRSRWSNTDKPNGESLKTLNKAVALFEESQYSVSKVDLLKKIKCQIELKPTELQLLAELIQLQTMNPDTYE